MRIRRIIYINKTPCTICTKGRRNNNVNISQYKPSDDKCCSFIILFQAEGIKQSYNVPVLIDLRNSTSFDGNANLTFPPGLVTDSEFIKLQVIGKMHLGYL